MGVFLVPNTGKPAITHRAIFRLFYDLHLLKCPSPARRMNRATLGSDLSRPAERRDSEGQVFFVLPFLPCGRSTQISFNENARFG